MKIVRLHNTDLSPDALADLPVETLSSLASTITSLVTEKLLAGASRDEDRIITVEEAAAITGLSPAHIRRHKTLPFVRQRTPHGAIRCSLAACRSYVAAQGRRRTG
jgi:hypothetical protein